MGLKKRGKGRLGFYKRIKPGLECCATCASSFLHTEYHEDSACPHWSCREGAAKTLGEHRLWWEKPVDERDAIVEERIRKIRAWTELMPLKLLSEVRMLMWEVRNRLKARREGAISDDGR